MKNMIESSEQFAFPKNSPNQRLLDLEDDMTSETVDKEDSNLGMHTGEDAMVIPTMSCAWPARCWVSSLILEGRVLENRRDTGPKISGLGWEQKNEFAFTFAIEFENTRKLQTSNP